MNTNDQCGVERKTSETRERESENIIFCLLLVKPVTSLPTGCVNCAFILHSSDVNTW